MKIRFTKPHIVRQGDGKGPRYERDQVYLFDGQVAETYARKYVRRGLADEVSADTPACNEPPRPARKVVAPEREQKIAEAAKAEQAALAAAEAAKKTAAEAAAKAAAEQAALAAAEAAKKAAAESAAKATAERAARSAAQAAKAKADAAAAAAKAAEPSPAAEKKPGEQGA